MLLSLSEIIEVVIHGGLTGARLVWPGLGRGPRRGRANPTLKLNSRRLTDRLRRSVSFPDNAQTLESEKLIDLLDVSRSRSDQRGEAASGHDAGAFAGLIQQQLQNAIHQP